jgi:hypothetical protein
MPRYGRRRARRPGANRAVQWLGLGVLGVLVVVLIAGFGFFVMKAYRDNPALAADLCPQTGPVAQTLVLLDTTDPWPAVTRAEVTAKLHDLRDGLKRGELLELALLDPATLSATTRFAQCNPGNGSELNDVTGNVRLARDRWAKDFDTPLETALESAVSAGDAPTSPIMAGIQKLAVERMVGARDRVLPTRLVVISDMLEHTRYFSSYKLGADFAAFQQSDASRRFSTDLAGAEVEIWMVQRPKEPADTRALANFWAQWIAANNGHFARAVRLQGVQP